MAEPVNGAHRVYQDGSRYHLPKDAPERERLEKQSASLVALMNNEPFHAPLSTPMRILDVGCGTGFMTDMLASRYPHAQVYGVDLAPVSEDNHKNKSNLEYVQGDIRELIGVDPRFEPGTFDYVFQRFFVCVSLGDWPKYVASIARLVKPGGWLEFQEPSMQMKSSTGEPLMEPTWWYQQYKMDAMAIGTDPEIGDHLCDIFKSTSVLENVEQSVYPFGPVPSADKPALHALEQQIPQLFAILIKKVCGDKRGEEEAEKIGNGLTAMWKKGFQLGDHFDCVAVIGQKK